MIIAAILVFSAFAVSFGWYYYAKQSVEKAIGIVQEQPEITPVQKNITAEKPAIAEKKAVLKLGERAAYRKPNGAQIAVSVKNIGSYAGSAMVYAELSYSQAAVANNSVTIPLIQPGQEMNVTISITYFRQWSGFDVRQI